MSVLGSQLKVDLQEPGKTVVEGQQSFLAKMIRIQQEPFPIKVKVPSLTQESKEQSLLRETFPTKEQVLKGLQMEGSHLACQVA